MPPPTANTAKNQDGILTDLSLLLSVLLLLSLGVLWSMDLNEPFGHDYDEGVYLCSARSAVAGHPLFTEVFSSQPPAFLKILTWSFYLFGDTVVVGRAAIVFFSVVCLAATGWLAWRMNCPLASPAAILMLGLTFIFFRQTNMVDAEIPALALALLGLALLPAQGSKYPLMRLIVAGFTFATGAMCKLLVAPMALPLVLLLLPGTTDQDASAPRNAPGSTGTPWLWGLLSRSLLFGTGSILALIVFCWPGDLGAIYKQAVTFHVDAKVHHPSNWSANFDMISKLFEAEPLMPLLALAGLLFLYWIQNYHALVLHLWILAAALFLVDHSPLFPRHVILLVPPLAITAAANMAWVSDLLNHGLGKAIALVAVACFLWGLGISLRKDLSFTDQRSRGPDPEMQIVRMIEERTQPADYVVSDEQMQVFRAGRQTPPQLCDTSFVRIHSGYLKDDEAIEASKDARMVLFRTGRLSQLPRYVSWVAANFRYLGRFGQSQVYHRVNLP